MKGLATILACLLFFASSNGETLTYVERGETDTIISSGLVDGLGDVDVFSNDLYDTNNAVKVGHHDGTCTLNHGAVYWFCSWNVQYPDENNELYLMGSIYNAEDRLANVAVVGGSGIFFGARGSATVISSGEFIDHGTTWRFTLTYELSAGAFLGSHPILLLLTLTLLLLTVV
mmetsp:Transcript_27330/g.76309  ORF Transcript_27330/g.76309 Transcript_27330/m.76309 type:complete len:173 (-) Transcript_27330:179-697(-)